MGSGMGTKSNEPIKNRSLNCEFLFTKYRRISTAKEV